MRPQRACWAHKRSDDCFGKKSRTGKGLDYFLPRAVGASHIVVFDDTDDEVVVGGDAVVLFLKLPVAVRCHLAGLWRVQKRLMEEGVCMGKEGEVE